MTTAADDGKHIARALNCIARAFELYNLNELAIAESGGKDSIVLCDLIDVYRSVHGMKRPGSLRINIVERADFDKSTHHIHFNHNECISQLDTGAPPALSSTIDGLNFNHALSMYHRLQPNVRAIFTGRRQTDVKPSSDERVDEFQAHTVNWPPLMRINPIASWTYDQIWEYIDRNNLWYPHEYSQGYTSLGPGAQPNPLLKREDGSYRHARELTDATKERNGRS